MEKIIFANLDLLKAEIDGVNLREYRDKFLELSNELCANEDNEIIFVSRDRLKLNKAKEFYESRGYTNYNFCLRDDVRAYVLKNKSQNNQFVFISGKDVDFHLAVNCKSLFIVPTWLQPEEQSLYYGILVDTPEQLFKFIKTLNNQNNWYSKLEVTENTTSFSLMDARYGYCAKTSEEKEMLVHFENLLKKNLNRNYYEILLYHFIAGMTNSTFFDDIELFGMIPSSNCSLNEDMFKFMKQVRYIKGKQLPRNVTNENLIIRHTPKGRAHNVYSSAEREHLGANDEFATLCINEEFRRKIDTLKKQNRFNVCIFDDYMTHGNTFNSVRNLLENIGANKIIFISLGTFNKPFQKKDYKIDGSVYSDGYNYELISTRILNNYQYQTDAKDEVSLLFDIFNM